MMRPSTRSKVLRLRGAGEGEGEGGGKDGYTIVQDGNGDFVIGGVDATVGVHGGGEENLVNTKIGEEGRMGIMCVDVGCQNTVAAMRSSLGDAVSAGGLGGGCAVLVQNDMSRLETPTAVALRGKKKEVGEIAATQPASNAQNMILDFLPLLARSVEDAAALPVQPPFAVAKHADSGHAAASVEFDGQEQTLPLELALAWQLAAMAKYGEDQLLSLTDKNKLAAVGGLPLTDWALALVVPGSFTERQRGALRDAAIVAGFNPPMLVPQAEALTQAYAERHKGGLRLLQPPSIEGVDEGTDGAAGGAAEGAGVDAGKRVVAIVDVGHGSTTVVLAAFSNSSARVLSSESREGLGTARINAAMMTHFSAQVEATHGAGSCASAKAKYRLAGAVEKLKRMLSTLDVTSVGVDGLIPDTDVSLKMTRVELEAMAAPICEEVSALVKLVLARAPGEVHAVEVVGGGTRTPCIAAGIQEAGGRAVGRTLDSSSALCQGASLVAALRNPTAVQNGTVPAVVCATPLEEAGGKGMGASLLAAALQERVRIDRMQLELVLIEAEVNQLEAMISETRREISEGPYKHLADAARSNELVDAAEEWVWQAPEGGYRLGEYREKTAALREELEKANGKVYAARREAQEKDHREMEQQAEERRKEEAAEPKEDHDSRKLKFEDRFRMAEANKAEAHELFGDGNIMHAADRYAKALAHCHKVIGDLTPEQDQRNRDLKGSLSLNLAQCFFKLNRFQKCVEHCNEALRHSADNTRATLRRGQAFEQLKKMDEALADAKSVLAQDPENAVAAKLLERVQENNKVQLEKSKKVYQKMFS